MAELIRGLDPDAVRANVAAARERIAAAAARAGRDPGDVRLLCAVKYVAEEELGVLAQAGLTLLGENRAQQLEAKARRWPDAGFAWHFIGALQSRKVRAIAPRVELIHSVASDSALRELGKHGTDRTGILVEVNVAEEEGKAGIAPSELPAFLERAAETPCPVQGLMTMPPLGDGDANRRHFAALRELAAAHDLRELSMGTSQDHEAAVEEGATIVRLGTSLLRS